MKIKKYFAAGVLAGALGVTGVKVYNSLLIHNSNFYW